MTRYYDRDFYRLADQYEELCREYRLIRPGFELVFSAGSKTYGNAYRVNEVAKRELWGQPDPAGGEYGSGHYRPTVGDDFLGMTAREACEALQNRRRMVWDLARAWDITKNEGVDK